MELNFSEILIIRKALNHFATCQQRFAHGESDAAEEKHAFRLQELFKDASSIVLHGVEGTEL